MKTNNCEYKPISRLELQELLEMAVKAYAAKAQAKQTEEVMSPCEDEGGQQAD